MAGDLRCAAYGGRCINAAVRDGESCYFGGGGGGGGGRSSLVGGAGGGGGVLRLEVGYFWVAEAVGEGGVGVDFLLRVLGRGVGVGCLWMLVRGLWNWGFVSGFVFARKVVEMLSV